MSNIWEPLNVLSSVFYFNFVQSPIRSIGIFVAAFVIFAIFGQTIFGIVIGSIIAGTIYKNSYDSADEKMQTFLGNIGTVNSYISSKGSRISYSVKSFYRYKVSVGYPNYLLNCEFKKSFKQCISNASETKNINKFGEVVTTRSPEKSYQVEDGVSIVINSPTSNTCPIRFVLTPFFAYDCTTLGGYRDDFKVRYAKRGDSIVQVIEAGQSLEFKFGDAHSGKGTYRSIGAYLCYKVDLKFTEE